MKKLLALGICLALVSPAAAALQETIPFTAVPSEAAAGTTTYNMTLAGGYTLGDIDWSGFASTINSGTYGSELTLDLTGPGAFGTQTVQLGSGTTYDPGAAFSGLTSAFENIGDPAGMWTFDFYEGYDDGSDGLADATWDNINFGFYDYVPPMPAIWCEGFETAVPPAGWDAVSYSGHSGIEMWSQGASAAEGLASAQCDWDPDLVTQDNWLVSPSATALSTMEVTGQTMGSYYWGVDPYDNYDIELWIIRGATYGDGDDDYVADIDDDNWLENWTWEEFSYDISGFLTPGETFSVGFRYAGVDGAQGNIDDVCLRGIPEPSTLALLGFGALALIRRRR